MVPLWRRWSRFENSSTPGAVFYLSVCKQLQGWSQNGARGGTKIVPLWPRTSRFQPFFGKCGKTNGSTFFSVYVICKPLWEHAHKKVHPKPCHISTSSHSLDYHSSLSTLSLSYKGRKGIGFLETPLPWHATIFNTNATFRRPLPKLLVTP